MTNKLPKLIGLLKSLFRGEKVAIGGKTYLMDDGFRLCSAAVKCDSVEIGKALLKYEEENEATPNQIIEKFKEKDGVEVIFLPTRIDLSPLMDLVDEITEEDFLPLVYRNAMASKRAWEIDEEADDVIDRLVQKRRSGKTTPLKREVK